MSTITSENGAVDELESGPQLTAADRCDSCGAQAYIRVVVNNGELLFCAHHGREHAGRMRAAGHEIHDQSGRLSHSE